MSDHPFSDAAHNSPLGQAVEYDAIYAPSLLFAIPRSEGRNRLGLTDSLPFRGCDIWNAYELSWLDLAGKPVVAWGEFRIPADSPNIVESKSFKLYLNSLNQYRCGSADEIARLMRRDVAGCVGADIDVRVHLPSTWATFPLMAPAGECLDDQSITVDQYTPNPDLLRIASPEIKSRQVFSRLLRSRCPVTGQPDWGTLCIDYTGPQIASAGLLAYIISFRQHQDFHEQCVERIFCEIQQRCAPHLLTVSARYLRRGGLDINPWRSSGDQAPANTRFFQQ